MSDTEKKSKKVTPSEEMLSFSWGGTTLEWAEEANQLMNVLNNKIDSQESDEKHKSKVKYKHMWNRWPD